MAVKDTKLNTKNPTSVVGAFGRLFWGVDSTVRYSQVLVTASNAGKCYQNNDPTSSEIPDLLDTDGGEVKLEGSRDIKAMCEFRSGILVFAANGVWFIFNPDGGFRATAYNVEKVTSFGIDSVKSIVQAENSVYYFSNSGIIQIASDDVNYLQATDITETTIKSLYIEKFVGKKTAGIYDEGSKQIVWWNPDLTSNGLIYDIRLQAFYPQNNASTEVKLQSPFSIANTVYYPSMRQGVSYNFSLPNSEDFKDFGEDQTAFMISGYETLGKFGNSKSAPKAKVFFKKTETQITGYLDGNYVYDKPSSCLFQTRWDYDSTDAGNRFSGRTGVTGTGKRMQIYQPLRRGFIPTEFPADFNTGQSVIAHKVGIRGSGDAVQFVFKAEPEKDLQLLGYTVDYKMKGRI